MDINKHSSLNLKRKFTTSGVVISGSPTSPQYLVKIWDADSSFSAEARVRHGSLDGPATALFPRLFSLPEYDGSFRFLMH